MSNKSFPVGTKVVTYNELYTGTIISDKDFAKGSFEDKYNMFNNYSQPEILKILEDDEDCYCILLDEDCFKKSGRASRYFWGSDDYWNPIKDSSNKNCNYEYILMLNSRCCKHCGEYE